MARDFSVDPPRLRSRGLVDFAMLEERVLCQLLRSEAHVPEYVI